MVAPNRTGSGLSLIPEENSRNMPGSSKSNESLYSNTSSSKGSATVLYRRTAAPCGRHSAFIPASSEVRQRVLSARRLRMKTFQNQLADAHQHISELTQENRMLRTLHKRQDLALAKYESTNAELPQLLNSHAEEVRVWQTKYRNLQAQNKDLLNKLKQKEAQILQLGDQNKHLVQLNKDKNLEDRQCLAEKVKQLETRLQEKDNDIKLLARRMQLESKNSRKDLLAEQKRRKEAFSQLEKVKLELSSFPKIDEFHLNNKLSKLSLKNIKNGLASKSQTHLKPLEEDKKDTDKESGDQSNRSTRTEESDNYLNTGRTSRKMSTTQLMRTSTHRGSGDGPSEEDQLNFIKSVEAQSIQESQEDSTMSDSKSEDNNSSGDDETGGDEYDEENESEIESASKEPKTRPHQTESVNSIRKEINDDFMQRESFLNAFCRTTTTDSKIPKISSGNRKTKLLAALKAIEGNSSQD